MLDAGAEMRAFLADEEADIRIESAATYRAMVAAALAE
jgi:hypothetical protein